VMASLVAVWFFVFGSMVGSFINVVVWRMPRGVSVVSSGSACPFCTARIKLSDNIPIFGWIKLRGRCRVCRLPISARYPIVETLFGTVFLLMFFVELQSAGANLPGEQKYLSAGILQVIINTKWDLILTYAFHMILLVMLITWSLMAYDRSRIPVKTIVFAIGAGIGVSTLFPYVHPVPWSESYEKWLPDFPWMQQMSTGLIGLGCGLFLGALLESLHRRPGREIDDGNGILVAMMTIGVFTGWQFAMTVVLFFGMSMVIVRLVFRRSFIPVSALLALATLVQLCLWKGIDSLTGSAGFVPGFAIPPLVAICGGVLVWSASRHTVDTPLAGCKGEDQSGDESPSKVGNIT